MCKDRTTKKCPRCKITFPRTTEFFHRCSSRGDGLQSYCKQCTNAKNQTRAKANPDKERARHHKYKIAHRKEEAAYARAHYDPEKRKKAKRLYKLRHPDADRSYAQRYRGNHKPQRKVLESNRRARKRNVPGSYTFSDIQQIGQSQHWRCWWCGQPCKKEYHVDHRIPLSKGGSNWPSNLVISCPHCNQAKYNKLPCEFNGRLL